MNKSRKIAVIGTGNVGLSYIYSMINQSIGVDEIILIDIDYEKACGEALDLNHGLAYIPKPPKIWAGNYSDCENVDIVVITAGVNRKSGQSRLELAAQNIAILKNIINEINKTSFNGIYIISSNPVDLMTYYAIKFSNFDKHKVIGSGTTLDTSRLRHILAEKLEINSNNIHSYILGEHGDSEFVSWDNTYIGGTHINDILKALDLPLSLKETVRISVKKAAGEVIEKKGYTSYGIGVALTKITDSIVNNCNSILSTSVLLDGEYGIKDVCLGVPTIINENGIRKIIELELGEIELEKLKKCGILLKKARENFSEK